MTRKLLGSPKTTPLAHWRSVRSLASTRQVNTLFIGDSVTEGTAVTVRSDRWQDKVVAALRTAYPSGATGGEGYVPSEYISSTMVDRFTFTGTTLSGAVTNGFGLGIRHTRLAAAATASATFTGTGVDLHISRGATASAPTVTIDGVAQTVTGGAATPSTPGFFGASTGHRMSFRGLTAGSHTIIITAGANYTYLEGITVYNGDETKGIIQYDAGHSAFRVADFLYSSTGTGLNVAHDVYGMVQPDLVVIALGLNDYGNTAQGQYTPGQMRVNLVRLVQELHRQTVVKPSIVLAKPYMRGDGPTPIAPFADYLQAFDDVVTIVGGDICTWDAGPAIGTFVGGTNPNDSGDHLHPNVAGHTAYATGAGGLAPFLIA
jgi:lysophospholipase L1-like esterase